MAAPQLPQETIMSGASPYALGAGVLGGLLFTGTAKKKRRGQTLQGVVSGASTGASLGSLLGPVGTGIGAGAGAILGGIIGSSEKSPEEIRDERFTKLVENTNIRRNKALSDGTQAIGKMTSGLMSRSRVSAGRRASAMGRTSDVEAFEAPIAGRVANEGNKSLSDFILNTNAQYDNILAQIDQARLMGEDIDPNMTDYLSELAPVAAQYAGNERQLSVLKKYLNLN